MNNFNIQTHLSTPGNIILHRSRYPSFFLIKATVIPVSLEEDFPRSKIIDLKLKLASP